MTDRIAEIAARCEKWKKQEAWHFECGLCEGNELAVRDIPYLLSQLAEQEKMHWVSVNAGADAIRQLKEWLAERDREIERLREAIASVHKSLDFADSQRQSCKNYTELAINNGLALGRIAVTLKHDFKEPLPAAPEEGAGK